MKDQGYTRPTRPEDVQVIADDMRPADVAEVLSSSGMKPAEALQQGLRTNSKTMTICLPDGTPVGMYGVAPTWPEGTGIVWMLAANRIYEIKNQLLAECAGHIDDLCTGYRLVYNYTDARNKVHHRWIKWAGFTIIKKHENFGVDGTAFLEFCKITEEPHV